MKHEFSDNHQQYQYFLDVDQIRELKRFAVSLKYQGAKFPDGVQSKTEIFLNADEWQRLKDIINSID
jgi:hypothetical protein